MSVSIPLNIQMGITGVNLTSLNNVLAGMATHTTTVKNNINGINGSTLTKAVGDLRRVSTELTKVAATAKETNTQLTALASTIARLSGAAGGASALRNLGVISPQTAQSLKEVAKAMKDLNGINDPKGIAAMTRALNTMAKVMTTSGTAMVSNLRSLTVALRALSGFQAPDMTKFGSVTRAIRMMSRLPTLDPTRTAQLTSGLQHIAAAAQSLARLSNASVNHANLGSIITAIRNLNTMKVSLTTARNLSVLGTGLNDLANGMRTIHRMGAVNLDPLKNVLMLLSGVGTRALPNPAKLRGVFTALRDGMRDLNAAIGSMGAGTVAGLNGFLTVMKKLNDIKVGSRSFDRAAALKDNLKVMGDFVSRMSRMTVDPARVKTLSDFMDAFGKLGKVRHGAATQSNLEKTFTNLIRLADEMKSRTASVEQMVRLFNSMQSLNRSGGGRGMSSDLSRANREASALRGHFRDIRQAVNGFSLSHLLSSLHGLKRTLTDLRFFMNLGGLRHTMEQWLDQLTHAQSMIQKFQMTLSYTMIQPGQTLAEGTMAAADAMALFREEANRTGQPLMDMYEAGTGMAAVLKASGMNTRQNLVDAMGIAQRLAAFDPAQGLRGANIAIREALSGDWRSLRLRFEIPSALLNEFKDQGLGAIQVIDQALNRMGITRDLVEKSAKTFGGQVQRFKNNFFNMVQQGSAAAYKSVTNTMDLVNERMEKFLKGSTGQRFAATLGEMFQGAATRFAGSALYLVEQVAPIFLNIRSAWSKDVGGIASVFRALGGLMTAGVDGFKRMVGAFGSAAGTKGFLSPLVMFTDIATLALPRAMERLGTFIGKTVKAIRPGLEDLQVAFVRVLQAAGLGVGSIVKDGSRFTNLFNDIASIIRRLAESLTMDNPFAKLVRGMLGANLVLGVFKSSISQIYNLLHGVFGVVGRLFSPLKALFGTFKTNSMMPTEGFGTGVLGFLRGRMAPSIAGAVVGMAPWLGKIVAGAANVFLGPILGGVVTFAIAAAAPVLVTGLIAALSPVAGGFITDLVAKIPVVGGALSGVIKGAGTLFATLMKKAFGPDLFQKISDFMNSLVTGLLDMVAYVMGQKVSPVTGKEINPGALVSGQMFQQSAKDISKQQARQTLDVMGSARVTGPDFSAVRALPGMGNLSGDQASRLLQMVFRATDGGTTDNAGELWRAVQSGQMGGFGGMLKNFTKGDLDSLVNLSRNNILTRGGFTEHAKEQAILAMLSGRTPETASWTGDTYTPALFKRGVVNMSEQDAITYNKLLARVNKGNQLSGAQIAQFRALQEQVGDYGGTARLVRAKDYAGDANTIPYGDPNRVLAYQAHVGTTNLMRNMGGTGGVSAGTPSSAMYGYLQTLVGMKGGDASKISFSAIQKAYPAIYKQLQEKFKGTPGVMDPHASQLAVMIQILRESGVNLDAINRATEAVKQNTKPGTEGLFDSTKFAAVVDNLSARHAYDNTYARRSKVMVAAGIFTAHQWDSAKAPGKEDKLGGTFAGDERKVTFGNSFSPIAGVQSLERIFPGINVQGLLAMFSEGGKAMFDTLSQNSGISNFIGNIKSAADGAREFATSAKNFANWFVTFQKAQQWGYNIVDAFKIAARGGNTANDIGMLLGAGASNKGANFGANVLGDLAFINPSEADRLRQKLLADPKLAKQFADKAGAFGSKAGNAANLYSPVDYLDTNKRGQLSRGVTDLMKSLGLAYNPATELSQDKLKSNIYGVKPGEPKADLTLTPLSKALSYDFIASLKDQFKNDPRFASDCAAIAWQIMDTLGMKLEFSANAGVLEGNAIKAGFKKIPTASANAGDMVVWTGKGYGAVSGKHVGVIAGYKDGKLMVIENPGSKNTQVVPMYDTAHAAVYRAPGLPAVAGTAGVSAGKGGATPDQQAKIMALAQANGIDPMALMAVIDTETGGQFKTGKYRSSGATGLMQWTTAGLTGMNNWLAKNGKSKVTMDQLGAMGFDQQLQYVMPYLKSTGKFKPGMSAEDLYMSVFAPAAVGKGDNFGIYGKGGFKAYSSTAPGSAYDQNKSIDLQGNKDQTIQYGEVVARLRKSGYYSANSLVTPGVPDLASAGAAAASGLMPPSAATGTAIVNGDTVTVTFSFGDIKVNGGDPQQVAVLKNTVMKLFDDPQVRAKITAAITKAKQNAGGR